jgi:4-aminobutyrate aminotransferase
MPDSSDHIFSLESSYISKTNMVRYYPMVVSRGEGALLWDADGREYIDFSSGGCVANLGYCHPEVTKAVEAQLKRLTHSCFTVCSNDQTPLLAERLSHLLPGKTEKKIWFGLSGSDANDWVYKILPKATGRPKLISFVGNYQGQTMGAAALSGLLPQQSFLSVSNVVHIPYPYCYRCPLGHHPEDCDQACFSYFENYLLGTIVSLDEIAGIVFEPIQGDGGIILPPEKYVARLYRFCKLNSIPLVVDEVLTGIGRSGTWWASEQLNIEPDLIVMGKALGSGVPISAVGGDKELMDAMVAAHHVTCGGNVLGSAAAMATLLVIEEDDLLSNARAMGERLLAGLNQLKSRHDLLGEIRGMGLLVGAEIERDGLPAPDLAHKVVYAAWKQGLLLIHQGLYGNVLILVPPLVIDEKQIDAGLERLSSALKMVEGGEISDDDIQSFQVW